MPENKIPGDVQGRITLDVGAGILPEDSILSYDAEMLKFRAIIEKEWEEHKKDNPDAIMHVPEDLPSAHIPSELDSKEWDW